MLNSNAANGFMATALFLALACRAPHPAVIGERFVRVAILEPPRPPAPCYRPLNSVYELRPDSQWMAVDSGVITCNGTRSGTYALGTHYGTAWGHYSRQGNRMWFAGDSIRQDGGVAEVNHYSRPAEVRGDSLVFLTGIETGPGVIYLRVRAR